MKVHVPSENVSEMPECQQVEEIGALKEKVSKIDKTLFFGNGVPAVTVQLATMKQNIDALTKLAWITLAAVIGQVVFLVFK